MHENTALEFEIAVYMHRKHTNLQPHFIDFSLRSQNTGIIHTFELRAAKTYVKSMYNRLSVHTIINIGKISLSNDEICVEGCRTIREKHGNDLDFRAFLRPFYAFSM